MKTPHRQADAALARCRRLLHDHRTRARKDGADLDYGLTEMQQLLAANPLCDYCRAPLSFAVQLDHRTPISRGGRHALANLAACCSRCNSMKGSLCESEFRELLTLLALLHPAARADLERRLLSGASRYGVARSRGKANRSPFGNLDAP